MAEYLMRSGQQNIFSLKSDKSLYAWYATSVAAFKGTTSAAPSLLSYSCSSKQSIQNCEGTPQTFVVNLETQQKFFSPSNYSLRFKY